MKSRQFLESGPLNSSTWGKRHPPPLSPLVVFVSAMSTRSGWVAWCRTRCASLLCIFRRLDFGFLKENSPVNVWLKWVTCRTKCGLVFCIFANRSLVLEWLIFIHILVFHFFSWYFPLILIILLKIIFHFIGTNFTSVWPITLWTSMSKQLLLVGILFLVAIIQTNSSLFRPSTTTSILPRRTIVKLIKTAR